MPVGIKEGGTVEAEGKGQGGDPGRRDPILARWIVERSRREDGSCEGGPRNRGPRGGKNEGPELR